MVIMHYFLGFPPYRSGGLTRFATDLMLQQADSGNKVIALWPGKMSFFNNTIKIKKRKNYNNVKNYELINPLPIPLDEGIRNVTCYTKKADENIFFSFLDKEKPEIIHIHTLMGLYSEFVKAAKKLNIKIVFTSHDFFGICPKVNLFKNGGVCTNDKNCTECNRCNNNALSITKIKLLQSPMYRLLKDSVVIKKLRGKHRSSFNSKDNSGVTNEEDYKGIRKYYLDILNMVDMFHFNSNLTKSVYEKYININNYSIITITHKNINVNGGNDNYKKNNKKLQLIYLSQLNEKKGYYFLKEALDDLWNSGFKNFVLNLYGNPNGKMPYMNVLGDSYDNKNLGKILKNMDLVLSPSQCYETFGFTVIEALSNGVPVLVTENVGSKDLIKDCGYIIKSNDSKSLKKIITEIDENEINKLHKNLKKLKIKKWNEFVDEIFCLYEVVINEK